jgi:hypothetical protein
MFARQHRSIVARWLGGLVVICGIALLLATPPAALAGQAVLDTRLQQWPDWSLPAPLPRADRQDLTYPDWCAGEWQVHSSDGSTYAVRFLPSPTGVVGDRAFNAAAVGKAVLGDRLAGVANDPANPNRQIAHLRTMAGEALELESTVVGRRSERPSARLLLVDELTLQVVHGRGTPVVSRVETLSRFEQRSDDSIQVEQWQATYPSPDLGLAATARRSEQFKLRLERSPQGSDRAS